MKTHDWGWNNGAGLSFQSRSWEPDRAPRGVLVLVHGLGEHTGRYGPVGSWLAAHGFALAGFDMRGHGLSAGPRGHTPDYDALLDDVSEFMHQVRLRFRDVPLFLYGHSLGGNLVLNFALRRRPGIQGVIATSPWLRVALEPPRAKLVLAKILNWVAPAFTQAWDLQTGDLSHDMQSLDADDDDPLVHGRISARLFIAVSEAGRWALQQAGNFPLPLLLMHGSADRVTSPEASEQFAARAGKQVTWRRWDGLFHELHNELSRDEVLGLMVQWLENELPAEPRARRHAGQKASGMREFGALS
jgi:alpha-beta hydrolase superfamily lysophospholipase